MTLDLATALPALARLPPDLAGAVAEQARELRVAAGSLLFDAGSACQALPLVLDGRIKVSRRSDSGREIRLYSVHSGELCIVTVSCLLGGDAYPATGVAETDVSALALPRPLFLRLVAEHAAFREAVFGLFADRLTGLMQLIEEVAFRRLDQRLAGWLGTHAPFVLASHQAIADELGSVREIVSRLLGQFADQGWVILGRGRIEVTDTAALEKFAANR